MQTSWVPDSVAVVGCGGIGSWLLPPLARYMAAELPGVPLKLWDGDRYTLANAVRQDFDLELNNKAEVQAARLTKTGLQLPLVPVASYVTKDNVHLAVVENGVCITCVDNHPARKRIARQAELLDNIVLISAGNETTDGNVCVHWRRDGEDLTESLLTRHPEIVTARGHDPGEGCEQAIVEGDTQLLITNFGAAYCVLNALFLILRGQGSVEGRKPLVPQDIYFDVAAGQMGTVGPVSCRS